MLYTKLPHDYCLLPLLGHECSALAEDSGREDHSVSLTVAGTSTKQILSTSFTHQLNQSLVLNGNANFALIKRALFGREPGSYRSRC